MKCLLPHAPPGSYSTVREKEAEAQRLGMSGSRSYNTVVPRKIGIPKSAFSSPTSPGGPATPPSGSESGGSGSQLSLGGLTWF